MAMFGFPQEAISSWFLVSFLPPPSVKDSRDLKMPGTSAALKFSRSVAGLVGPLQLSSTSGLEAPRGRISSGRTEARIPLRAPGNWILLG